MTSLVPSGKVASTWISWIISGMPAITWSRAITAAPEAEDNPLDAIPDGVSFRMADDPQTYRDMMLGAGLTLMALGAGAWLAAAVRRRRERRRRLKKRQERKKQRQNTLKKTDARKNEEKKA